MSLLQEEHTRVKGVFTVEFLEFGAELFPTPGDNVSTNTFNQSFCMKCSDTKSEELKTCRRHRAAIDEISLCVLGAMTSTTLKVRLFRSSVK